MVRAGMAPIDLSLRQARRLAVAGQLLSAPRPTSIAEVVRGLGEVQVDPTSAVARTEQLVLWSRIGRSFRVADLERMLYRDRELFEYRAHILPVTDYPLYRPWMRRWPAGDNERERYFRSWLAANDGFRRYVLRELRRRGPLLARDFEDRVAEGWRTGGWNDDGRSVTMMLEALWRQGRITVVGREGQQRVWDLAECALPTDAPPVASGEAARRILVRQLRARGVATRREFGFIVGRRPPGWERALRGLVRDGVAVPVTVEGQAGEWFAHVELLDRPFRPRTTLLSPFDDLVSDRGRTERLFGFTFRLEIYVPKLKRQHGYFVLPILHGDRLIGRIDPLFDRRSKTLVVNAAYAEPEAPPAAGRVVARSIRELAAWLGAADVRFAGAVPSVWRAALID
jgi:uncharacterized protein YcaQ